LCLHAASERRGSEAYDCFVYSERGFHSVD
jgi:hypothetical protein